MLFCFLSCVFSLFFLHLVYSKVHLTYFSFLKWLFLGFQITEAFGLTKFLFYIYSPPSKVGLFASLCHSFRNLTFSLIPFLPYMRFHSLWFLPAAYMSEAACLAFLSKNHGHSVMWSLSLYFAYTLKDKCRRIFLLLVPFAFLINHLSQHAAVFYWSACIMWWFYLKVQCLVCVSNNSPLPYQSCQGKRAELWFWALPSFLPVPFPVVLP